MNHPIYRFFFPLLFLLLSAVFESATAAEPRVQIVSPKDGSRLTQEQNLVFVSGKVTRDAGRSASVDIFLVVDISGSTAQYAGTDLGEAGALPDNTGSGFPSPQISI